MNLESGTSYRLAGVWVFHGTYYWATRTIRPGSGSINHGSQYPAKALNQLWTKWTDTMRETVVNLEKLWSEMRETGVK